MPRRPLKSESKSTSRNGVAGNSPKSGSNGKLRPSRDIMSPEKRSAVMARIRGKNTGPERLLAEMLRSFDVSFESHCGDLPGRPDFVFREIKLVIFVDGDFWHGWRFPLWRHKLTGNWEQKIAETRRRDLRNHSRLRRRGWRVVRFWEHHVVENPDYCKAKLVGLLSVDKKSNCTP